MKKDTVILVAAFQVSELSEEVVHMCEHREPVFIVATSEVKFSKRNPLSYKMRKQMILKALPQADVHKIKDHPLKQAWSEKLEEIISRYPENSEIIFSSGIAGKYTGKLKVSFHNALDRREHLDKVINSRQFRRGVIYASLHDYPHVFATVDVAVVKDGKVLMAKKKDRDQLRFIGGFTDPTDRSFTEAARREVREEAGIEITDLRIIGSTQVDDWRYRKESDKVMTTFFMATYLSGEPKAEDDITELHWVDMKSMKKEDVVYEHGVLWEMLREGVERESKKSFVND